MDGGTEPEVDLEEQEERWMMAMTGWEGSLLDPMVDSRSRFTVEARIPSRYGRRFGYG